MKKCDHFKELILTDYIDGELNKEMAGNVENHLLDCGDCRAFFKEVKMNASLPFQQVPKQAVPAELWAAIKENIEHDQQPATNPFADFVERLKEMVFFPRLVPVFATLVVMLLAGSVTVNTIQGQQAKAKDQGEYLVALLTPAQAESNDLGTPIEHYFL